MSKIELDSDFDYKDNTKFAKTFWRIFWATAVLGYVFSIALIAAFMKMATHFL